MSYRAGIDIGGTFTDCIVFDGSGSYTVSKTPSTPDDFATSFFDVLELAAKQRGLTLSALLEQTEAIAHGTTVATNAMVERRGARVGLLTTAGHRDVLRMMRAYGRVAGLPPMQLLHYSQTSKPEPIVDDALIEEVHERIDSRGRIVISLNEPQAADAIDRLLASGAQAISIALLWGFRNPVHERRLAAMVHDRAPGMFVSVSSALVPRLGEYERTAATAINSYVGPATGDYLARITKRAKALGLEREINVMQCSGGVTPAHQAAASPIHLLESGPAGGVIASKLLGDQVAVSNILATDMGGTTFDAALIVDGTPASASTTIIDQFEFYVPTLAIQSIGSGGGSIASFDEATATIKVGPESAGALPGPVAYGRGGVRPTVSDADLVLGYLNPEYFLGGALPLDRDAAVAAYEQLGQRIGKTAVQTAAGVTQVADYQMAGLLRRMTIERGSDPRDLVVFAYGGAGPVHGCVYARELGAKQLVVPLGDVASVWSAMGVVRSDVLHVYEQSDVMTAPWDRGAVQAVLDRLAQRGLDQLRTEGFTGPDAAVACFADIRYSLQVHVVEVPIADGPMAESGPEDLRRAFETRYAARYGKAAGFSDAGTEIVTLRVRATGSTRTASAPAAAVRAGPSPAPEARKPARRVYWHEWHEATETDIYDGQRLLYGNRVPGPCVIELPDTTLVVRPGQTAQVDAVGSIVVDL